MSMHGEVPLAEFGGERLVVIKLEVDGIEAVRPSWGHPESGPQVCRAMFEVFEDYVDNQIATSAFRSNSSENNRWVMEHEFGGVEWDPTLTF
jgi:hypothetical protein